MYCIAVVLVIVDGQPTTDDDVDKDEISKLIDTVAELRAELTKVKGKPGTMNAKKPPDNACLIQQCRWS